MELSPGAGRCKSVAWGKRFALKQVVKLLSPDKSIYLFFPPQNRCGLYALFVAHSMVGPQRTCPTCLACVCPTSASNNVLYGEGSVSLFNGPRARFGTVGGRGRWAQVADVRDSCDVESLRVAFEVSADWKARSMLGA